MSESLGPVQATAPGLLSLLSLKQLGHNPRTLNDEVIPTIDILNWFLQTNIEAVVGTAFLLTVPGVFGFALQVPAQEIWYVHSATITADLIAGEALRGRLGYIWDRGAAAPPAHPLSDFWAASPAVPNARTQVGNGKLNMWLPANRALVLIADVVTTAADISCNIEAFITRLKV